jgi:(2Fe-2S) ferredoxin
MKLVKTPHALHLLFCTNTRADGSKSCGDNSDTAALAETLKLRCKQEKLPVRITRAGCLGPCAQGPNVMCYPQGLWWQDVNQGDADAILAEVKTLLAQSPLL